METSHFSQKFWNFYFGDMALFGCLALVLLFVAAFVAYLIRQTRLKFYVNKIPGPRGYFGVGNLHQFRLNPDEFFEQAQGASYMLCTEDLRMVRVWMAHMPFLLMYGAEEVETILGSNKILTKAFQYQLLSTWIGQGLLISEPNKWRPRRKLLTPTFHYDILKDFVCVYNKHSNTLIEKFESYAGHGFRDIFHDITLCTLDVICEAALGKSIEAQKNPNSPYLKAVMKMKYLIHQRQIKPHLYADFMHNLIGTGKQEKEHVHALHELTSKVINERKAMVDAAGGVQELLEQEKASGRKRMAFLDLMLDMNAKGQLPMEGIQEEVDTFTFEGHDTTSTSMNWFLHLMGANPQIQARLHRELDEVFGDSDREVTYDDLGHLQYLERCIKEGLRLYPSVPLIAREIKEDTTITSFHPTVQNEKAKQGYARCKVDVPSMTPRRRRTLHYWFEKWLTVPPEANYHIPAGTTVIIVPSMVHRDPKYWPDAEVFDPDRFLPENAVSRHPYAYIPFSAGARNCIGQRFALMEEKCVLSAILRRFKVKSKLRTDQMRLSAELIIRPMYGNHISFEKRTFGQY